MPNKEPEYVELHCVSNFSFLRGASRPDELVKQAAELGYRGIAITDECSVAGIVRAHGAVPDNFQLIVGSEFHLDDGLRVVVLAVDRQSYGELCQLISQGRRVAEKGDYRLSRKDLEDHLSQSECLLLWLPDPIPDIEAGQWISKTFYGRVWLAVELLVSGEDRQRFLRWSDVAKKLTLPMVAAGNVHMHRRSRRVVQDTLTAIRLKTTVDRAGFSLYPNGERYLRDRQRLKEVYPEKLLNETMAIAERINFSLNELCYEYPRELVPDGHTPTTHLRTLTREGMGWRWPDGANDKVRTLVEHELKLIEELKYESYFLTVHDIVRFARSEGILCQGRGSAANSAVCFCLGITEVDPARMDMLVERFISKERNEPPDIDVDFEHERREEVIQYIYNKYGRHRAALAATVISYRPRSALRDVGKALGLTDMQVDALAKSLQWWDGPEIDDSRILECGLDPQSPTIRRLLYLVKEIMGFPRHLSQHVGGFVIARDDLETLVPIENAAMPDRTVIQWDKDDLEELGLLKVDVLGLGMLSAIRRSFELLDGFHNKQYSIATIPSEDPAVYEMISRGDTMGVFQIESRAQMAMLPRLRPRCYYDLVIEVAIIRPGPIQGDMVHPYLRRRNGEEPVSYPSPDVEKVLKRTLGVPIFQEQVMQLAVVAAGFTPGEADQLRRAMAAWKRKGGLGPFEQRLMEGMQQRGYSRGFAAQIFNQIQGFGEYGFPESHSASFALLVYVSAWLKHYHPAIFCCALLNSQPMGFYAPAQLVRNAIEHGVSVRPVDVNHSHYESTLEPSPEGEPCLRLGLRLVKGMSKEGSERVMAEREFGSFQHIEELGGRCQLDQKDLGALAAAGALGSITSNRHRARWDVAGVPRSTPLFRSTPVSEGIPMLRPPSEGDNLVADYRQMGLTLGRHPLAMLRGQLEQLGVTQAKTVCDEQHGQPVVTAGLVINRQRPASAAGVTFVTLEDETGYINLIVWQNVAQRQRRVLLGASLLGVHGEVQKDQGVVHVVAKRLFDHSFLLGRLTTKSRDFR